MNASTATTLPTPEATPEVLAFARDKGIERELANVLEATRSDFPTQPIRMSVYSDHELPDVQKIILEVIHPTDSTAEWMAVRERWFDATPAPMIPSTHYHWFGMDLQDAP